MPFGVCPTEVTENNRPDTSSTPSRTVTRFRNRTGGRSRSRVAADGKRDPRRSGQIRRARGDRVQLHTGALNDLVSSRRDLAISVVIALPSTTL